MYTHSSPNNSHRSRRKNGKSVHTRIIITFTDVEPGFNEPLVGQSQRFDEKIREPPLVPAILGPRWPLHSSPQRESVFCFFPKGPTTRPLRDRGTDCPREIRGAVSSTNRGPAFTERHLAQPNAKGPKPECLRKRPNLNHPYLPDRRISSGFSHP